MESQPDIYITSKFSEYRERYRQLEKYYEKKKKPLSLFKTALKINGEAFTSGTLMGEKFDYAYHSCGQKSYPSSLENNSYYWEPEFFLTPKQLELLDESFSKFVYTDDRLKYEFENYKGLWPWGISAELLERKDYVSFTGQFGDYLSLCVEDYFEIIENIFALKEFKKITMEGSDDNSLISILDGNDESSAK
jgi:hypothetical protein